MIVKVAIDDDNFERTGEGSKKKEVEIVKRDPECSVLEQNHIHWCVHVMYILM